MAATNGYDTYKLIFFASFVSMQLIEYFLWRYIDDKRINSIFTVLSFVLITLQPIAAILLLHENKSRMWLLLTVYLVVMSVPVRLFFYCN